jgi:hypothetical protein
MEQTARGEASKQSKVNLGTGSGYQGASTARHPSNQDLIRPPAQTVEIGNYSDSGRNLSEAKYELWWNAERLVEK